VRGKYGSFGTLRGNPNDKLRDITLENIDVTLGTDALALGPVENFQIKNVVVNGRPYVPPAAGAAKP